MPDEITIPMVLETLKEKGKDGWLLDGFPRNITQAKKLWEALQEAGMKLDYVVEIKLDREIAKKTGSWEEDSVKTIQTIQTISISMPLSQMETGAGFVAVH